MPRINHTMIAGDTEPTTFTVTVTSQSELGVADVGSMKLYARENGAESNHVDGATVAVDSVATEQQSDGTWKNEFAVSFDPEGNGPAGGDAFGTGDEGVYAVYVLVAWSDGDETRHPNEGYRQWKILKNFEG